MRKYFIAAGIRGEYDKLIDRLNEQGFDKKNPNHIFVALGNFLGGTGKGQYKVFNFLKDLKENNKAIIIKGNQEDIYDFREVFIDEDLKSEVGDKFDSVIEEFKTFTKDLPYFFETDNHIMVSAGLDPSLPDWKQTKQHSLEWTDSMTWTFNDMLFRVRNEELKSIPKTIIAGFIDLPATHFFDEHGYLPYYKKGTDRALINIPFKKANYVNIEGSWNKEYSKGLVYVIED